MLSDAVKAELKATADALSSPGKGFLASDESAGPWLRAGHVEAKKIADTPENRAAYRAMLYTTPGLSQYISGVILHQETLFQKDAKGNEMTDLITGNGMIPGIKLDKGYDKTGLMGTATGPLGHPETWCKGIDDLEKRCQEAYAKGARFAKWRNVLQIDPKQNIPSDLAIEMCVQNLAQYASICQRNKLCPIVEPEIVPNGDHSIEVCAEITERVLVAQFRALALHNVYLEGAVLKPNMVKNGLGATKAAADKVAELTVQALRRTVPAAMPGIFFLSGETVLDEDNEETATLNLNAMHSSKVPALPWHLSFSYGKALQKTCIVTWMGKEENNSKAQAALLNRAKANSEATYGKYVAGSCASIGAGGNVQMAGGAY
jgi:fructose-bisphosphate aldolase class I